MSDGGTLKNISTKCETLVITCLLTAQLKHFVRPLISFPALLIICYSTLQALNWVFVVDTMNFSFWPETEIQQCEVTYKGTTYTGYMTLCAAITRAMEEGESPYRSN